MALLRRGAQLGLGRLAGAYRAAPAHINRSFAEAADPDDDGDIVLEVFQGQQKAYRDFLEGVKSIPVPLSLEPEAVKQYATSMEALKKKVGIPDVEEVTNATLDHKLLVAGGNVRSFLQSATEGVPLGSDGEVVTKLFAALDKVEAASGPVEPGNDQAINDFQKELTAISKEAKLEDLGAFKSEAIVEMYKEQLKGFRAAVEDEIDVAKRRDGLEGINVDINSIKPKFV